MRPDIQKIECERKRLGWSKSLLSKNCGFSISTYNKIIENGSTTIKTLTKIAETLHVDPRDLLSI
jgi:transcriptional regulator with XRE-family HTH domain